VSVCLSVRVAVANVVCYQIMSFFALVFRGHNTISGAKPSVYWSVGLSPKASSSSLWSRLFISLYKPQPIQLACVRLSVTQFKRMRPSTWRVRVYPSVCSIPQAEVNGE